MPAWTTRRRFLSVLLLIVVAAAGIRVAYVIAVTRHQPKLYGDQIAYSRVARTLADGKGFRDPFITNRTVPDADHPPLTSLAITPAYLIFGDGSRANTIARLTIALLGAGTVMMAGFAGRRIAANVEVDPDSPVAMRVGWIAAMLAAVLPGIWMHDGLLMSEGPGALTIALVIWLAVRALDRPGAARFAWLGVGLGLAALVRSETILLAPLLLIPLAFTRRGDRRDRSRTAGPLWLVVGGLGLAVTIAPWVVPNILRFEDFTTLSTTDGGALAGSNCAAAYHGSQTGLWVLECELKLSDPNAKDGSVNNAHFRAVGLRYIRNHLTELPRVVAVREARTWSVWSPHQEVYLDSGEGDKSWVAWASMIGSWAMMPLGALGMIALRRRDRPVWPIGVQVVAVSVNAALFYGLSRFRIGADVALLVGAAVAIEAGFRRLFGRQEAGAPSRAILTT